MEGELPRILVGEKNRNKMCESKPRRQRGKDASIVVGKQQGKLVAKESSKALQAHCFLMLYQWRQNQKAAS